MAAGWAHREGHLVPLQNRQPLALLLAEIERLHCEGFGCLLDRAPQRRREMGALAQDRNAPDCLSSLRLLYTIILFGGSRHNSPEKRPSGKRCTCCGTSAYLSREGSPASYVQ